MERMKFLEEPKDYANDAEFIARIPKVDGKDGLLNCLANGLNFPDYFGYNWEALYNCLRDFHWIQEKGVVLVHNEIPNLSNDELKTYVEILFDAVKDWKEGEEHYFKVIFPESSKNLIQSFYEPK